MMQPGNVYFEELKLVGASAMTVTATISVSVFIDIAELKTFAA